MQLLFMIIQVCMHFQLNTRTVNQFKLQSNRLPPPPKRQSCPPGVYSFNDQLNPIGTGSFSKVYIGQGPQGRVAVKLVQWCSTGGINYGSLRELATLKRLQRCGHPNVLKLLDVFVSELGKSFCQHIVFELLDCDLRQLMRARGNKPLDLPLVASLIRQLLSGLAHLHSHRVLHRDLKPQNLLLDWSATVLKIADFNSSRLCSWERSLSRVATTLAYRAPEALLSESYGTPADIWSVGCILYEMLTAKWAFPCCSRGEAQALCCIAAGVLDSSSNPELPSDAISHQKHLKPAPAWLINESIQHIAKCPPLRARLASDNASPEALRSEPNGPIDLLCRLLAWLPTDRPNAAQALASSAWLAGGQSAPQPVDLPEAAKQAVDNDEDDYSASASNTTNSSVNNSSCSSSDDASNDSSDDEDSSASSWLTCSDSEVSDYSSSDESNEASLSRSLAASVTVELDYADYIEQQNVLRSQSNQD